MICGSCDWLKTVDNEDLPSSTASETSSKARPLRVLSWRYSGIRMLGGGGRKQENVKFPVERLVNGYRLWGRLGKSVEEGVGLQFQMKCAGYIYALAPNSSFRPLLSPRSGDAPRLALSGGDDRSDIRILLCSTT